MSNNEQPTRAKGLAIASLALGIIGLMFFGIILGLTGFILGSIALAQKTTSRGIAISGTILSAAAFLFSLIAIIFR